MSEVKRYLPLPMLKISGDIIPFDGEPYSEERQALIRRIWDAKFRRNYRRRKLYKLKHPDAKQRGY
jgi:hypothetical protein